MSTPTRPKPHVWPQIHEQVLSLITVSGPSANKKVLINMPLEPGAMAWEQHDQSYAIIDAEIVTV